MTKNTTTQYKELEHGEITLDEVTVSGDNFRKEFNEEALKELSENIAKVGVLEPIILRKNRAHKILVAGERRLRAAQMAGLQTIPYRLLDLTEEQAREVMVLENLHRKDLSPIEEARGFNDLLKSGGYTAEDVANRVDKSKAYVYRAIRLLDLPQEAQDALEKGEITTGHARQLLCVSADEAKELLKKIKRREMSVTALRDEIKWTLGTDLEDSRFKLDVEYAGKIACSKCPYNTANQQSLFDEAVEAGRCTNKACYEEKEKQSFADLVEEVKAKAQKAGMKFLDPQDRYDYDESYEIMDQDEQEQYADEIKKHPGKFALTVFKYSGEEGMLCIDKKLAKKINDERYAEDEEEEEETEEEKAERAERERGRAIRDKEEEFLAGKLLGELLNKEITDKVFENLWDDFRDWQKEALAKNFGLKSLTVDEVLKLEPKKLFWFMSIVRTTNQWGFNEDICTLLDDREITEEEIDEMHAKAVAAIDSANK